MTQYAGAPPASRSGRSGAGTPKRRDDPGRRAVRDAGTLDADAVVRVLDRHRFDDAFARNADFWAVDQMVVHDLYVA